MLAMFGLHLTGPQFLLVYFVLGVVTVAWLARHFRRTELPDDLLLPHLTNPYQIAQLRAGPNEAVRVAMASLIDRKLLAVSGDTFKSREIADDYARHPIEKAVLGYYRGNVDTLEVFKATSVQLATQRLNDELVAQRLLANRTERLSAAGIALGVLAVVALLRIQGSGRPFVFLIMMAVAFAVIVLWLVFRRQSALGRATVKHLQTMFARLKARASTLRAGGATNEVALLAAVFGIAALKSAEFAALKKLQPKNEGGSSCGSSSCGSSSGSSCGGGGGCGGGCGS